MYDTEEYVNIYNEVKMDFSLKVKENILSYLKTNNKKIESLLDLGCGTGVFLDEMQKTLNLKTCVGIDISKNMIDFSVKKIKNKNIKFILGDMTKFSLNQKFDLITCNFNAINHVLNFEDWEEMFKRVFSHLSEGGVFAFDINTLSKMKMAANGLVHYSEFDNYNYVSCLKYENDIFSFNDTIYIKKENGLFKMLKQETYEKGFENNMIKLSLKRAGFRKIAFLDKNYQKIKNTKSAKRIYIVCEK